MNNLDNSKLIAPGCEGIHAVEWANAMLCSSIAGNAVRLPLDREEYDLLLNNLRIGKITL
jgi:hypothetical protein